MPKDVIKKNIGIAAANLVQNGMTVGLGTGSTAHCFIESLIERCKLGLKIQAVASSQASLSQAKQGGIPVIDINKITSIDMTIDGADEIDPLKQMIKGAGGALLREKILATMSHEMVVIIDESKLVSKLGKRSLPVEILPFACLATIHRLEKMGYKGAWRKDENGSFFITDNGNYIFDIQFDTLRDHPKQDHEAIIQLPGVIETGFFFNLAGRVIIGFADGQIVTQ